MTKQGHERNASPAGASWGPARLLAGALALGSIAACTPAVSPGLDCAPDGEKWVRRAKEDLQVADLEEARDSAAKALAICPVPPVRTLAAQIALARLDYDETLRLLKPVQTSEAAGLRGRALWYKGELKAAADELDTLLNDPEVHDDWAKAISKLARRGAGRSPFTVTGGLLAPIEMPHVSPVAPFFVVPLEVDGESALAMIATGTAEVVLDSTTRKEPSWVSLRFGDRVEVQDVPALSQDLSGISKQIGAPIKAMIGVNLLRHLNATIDYGGRQFVVRSFAPPAPPNASRVDLAYLRGGGMVMAGGFGTDRSSRASLLVDTTMGFPIALDEAGWKKAGLDASKLSLVPEDPTQKMREGVLPLLRVGAFEIPRVPGYFGAPIAEVEKALGVDLDGMVGAGLLAHFRITFGDGGRLMWIEDDQLPDARSAAPPAAAPEPMAPEGPGPG